MMYSMSDDQAAALKEEDVSKLESDQAVMKGQIKRLQTLFNINNSA